MENSRFDERSMRQLQLNGAIKKMFNETLFPQYINADGSIKIEHLTDILEYASMFTAWREGNTVYENGFVHFGYDENLYPKLYQSTETRVMQDNINPDTEGGQLTYHLIGYRDGVRIWTRPFSEDDSYALDEIVPDLLTSNYTSVKEYVNGNVLYRNDVFLYNEKWYVVNSNQITVSNYVNPESTEQTVYVLIPFDEYKLVDNVLTVYKWHNYKSKKDDNRFRPSENNIVWEIIE